MNDFEFEHMESMAHQIRKELFAKNPGLIRGRFSIGGNTDRKITNVVIPGRVQFYAHHNEHWYQDRGLYEWWSKVYENPTWVDVMEAFECAIRETGDTHHIFLEGLIKDERFTSLVTPSVYYFSTGS